MKMPNKHSAPSGRRPVLRMDSGGMAGGLDEYGLDYELSGMLMQQDAPTGMPRSDAFRPSNDFGLAPTAAPNLQLGRAGFLARNPGIATNYNTSPSPATMAPKTVPTSSPDFARPPKLMTQQANANGLSRPILRQGNSYSDMPGQANTTPMSAQDQGAFNGLLARTPDAMPDRNAAGNAYAAQNKGVFRLADGGAPVARPVSPFSLRGISNSIKGAFTQTPEEAARAAAKADYVARSNAERAAARAQPVPAAPAPTSIAAPMGSQSVLQRREAAAGLRNGGKLDMTSRTMHHTGDGGPVPGKGKGDKTKALYEKGEFVVSNAMLKAKPSLRGELHDLRKQVLAAKGMTPEEADAKAVGGGTLRANEGWFNPETGMWEPATAADGGKAKTRKWTAEQQEILKNARNATVTGDPTKVPQPEAAPKAAIPEVSPIPKGQGPQTGAGAPSLAERQAAWNAAPDIEAKPQTLAERINARNALSESRIADKISGVTGGAKKVSEAIGGRLRAAGDVIEAVSNNPYVKVAGAAYGGYQATQEAGRALDAINEGNNGEAARRGALTVANAAQIAPLLGRATLGAAGTAYAVGDAIGSRMDSRADQGKSTFGYDAATKNSLGQAVNSVVGGADDTSVRAKALVDKYGATGVPQAEIDALYANSLRNKKPAAPEVKAAPTNEQRAADMLRTGGLQPEDPATTQARVRQAAADREALYADRLAREANEARNGPTSFRSQLRNMQDMNADTLEGQLMRGEIGDPRAREAIAANAERRSKLREQEIQSNGVISAAEIQAGGARRSAEIGVQSNAQRNQLELMKYALDEKKFGAEVADKLRDDRRVGEEAFAKKVMAFVGPDPDGAKTATVLRNAHMFIGDQIKAAQAELKANPNNVVAARDLARLQNGLSGLDDKVLSNLIASQRAQELANEHDGYMPWAGKSRPTSAPITSLKKKEGWIFDDYVSDDASGNQVIPARAVKKNPDMNRLRIE